MTVHWVNVVFMVSLAVFASVAAAVLAVLFSNWWDDRQWRRDLDKAEQTAPLTAERVREDRPDGA
jgi:amino acid transporter